MKSRINEAEIINKHGDYLDVTLHQEEGWIELKIGDSKDRGFAIENKEEIETLSTMLLDFLKDVKLGMNTKE